MAEMNTRSQEESLFHQLLFLIAFISDAAIGATREVARLVSTMKRDDDRRTSKAEAEARHRVTEHQRYCISFCLRTAIYWSITFSDGALRATAHQLQSSVISTAVPFGWFSRRL